MIINKLHYLQAFHSIKDKSKASHELLGFAGCLADHLIHGIEIKSERLALMAQISPSLLEWLRKQVHLGNHHLYAC